MFEKLKEEMTKQGISRNRLALMARIAPSDFYNAINGNRKFYPGWRSRVADALGVSVEELFDDED